MFSGSSLQICIQFLDIKSFYNPVNCINFITNCLLNLSWSHLCQLIGICSPLYIVMYKRPADRLHYIVNFVKEFSTSFISVQPKNVTARHAIYLTLICRISDCRLGFGWFRQMSFFVVRFCRQIPLAVAFCHNSCRGTETFSESSQQFPESDHIALCCFP